MDALCAELKQPKYGQYDVCELPHVHPTCVFVPPLTFISVVLRQDFSNILQPGFLDAMAKADANEVVREVHEYFADFLAVNPHLVSWNQIGVLGDSPSTWRREAFERTSEGLLSLLLALKKRPVIRLVEGGGGEGCGCCLFHTLGVWLIIQSRLCSYQQSSDLCRRLGEEINECMQHESSLFDFRQTHDAPPILLVGV